MLETQQRILRVLQEDGPRLYALLVRITLRYDAADDLMQDLFVHLSGSAEFQRVTMPSAYAWRAAMHLGFNWRRNRVRHNETSVDVEAVAAREPLPLASLERAEQVERLMDDVGRLPQELREVLVMRFIEGRSYEEIGRLQGRTAHHTRAMCHKGIQRLRGRIELEVGHVERETPSSGNSATSETD
jgi:RNA polymerase sigma factor (sigma-70 family)